VTTFDPGPLGVSDAPERLAEFRLHVDPGVIALAIVRYPDGRVAARLTTGGYVGLMLSAEQIAALRVTLADVLGTLYQLERERRAA
jgi:hypothetical protein